MRKQGCKSINRLVSKFFETRKNPCRIYKTNYLFFPDKEASVIYQSNHRCYDRRWSRSSCKKIFVIDSLEIAHQYLSSGFPIKFYWYTTIPRSFIWLGQTTIYQNMMGGDEVYSRFDEIDLLLEMSWQRIVVAPWKPWLRSFVRSMVTYLYHQKDEYDTLCWEDSRPRKSKHSCESIIKGEAESITRKTRVDKTVASGNGGDSLRVLARCKSIGVKCWVYLGDSRWETDLLYSVERDQNALAPC